MAREISGPRVQSRSRARLTAETSTEPEGITRRVMLNILEAFFRRPWLHLLPLILMLGVGAASAVGGDPEYRAVGTLSATNESLLADLTATNAAGVTFETPAEKTARQINEFMRTEAFLDRVAEAAGITTALEQIQLLRGEVRSSVGAFADGDNLVRVSATTNNPELSQRLAQATITSYIDQIVADATDQSTASEEFLQSRVDTALTDKENAYTALGTFLTDNPQANSEEPPPALAQALNQLQADIDRAETRYADALSALDEAKTSTASARDIVNQRLRPSDPPERPAAAESGLRNAILTMFLFGALGLMMTIALVVISATLDRTIRVPNDITAKFGLDVLAVVPAMRR